MFTTVLVIASIALAFAAGTTAGYTLCRRASLPVIERLGASLANATWHLAHDQLTATLNRRGLQTTYIILASTDPGRLAVALIDLDRFKEVNDTYGHAAGDHILIEVANRLELAARTQGGRVARLSGDEFATVLPLADHDPVELADRLLAVFDAPFEVTADDEAVAITVTASLGVTIAGDSVPLENVALAQADTAMYHSKRAGGNRHAIYNPGMVMPPRQRRRGPRQRDLHPRAEVSDE